MPRTPPVAVAYLIVAALVLVGSVPGAGYDVPLAIAQDAALTPCQLRPPWPRDELEAAVIERPDLGALLPTCFPPGFERAAGTLVIYDARATSYRLSLWANDHSVFTTDASLGGGATQAAWIMDLMGSNGAGPGDMNIVVTYAAVPTDMVFDLGSGVIGTETIVQPRDSDAAVPLFGLTFSYQGWDFRVLPGGVTESDMIKMARATVADLAENGPPRADATDGLISVIVSSKVNVTMSWQESGHSYGLRSQRGPVDSVDVVRKLRPLEAAAT
jgi:hypothetical protein